MESGGRGGGYYRGRGGERGGRGGERGGYNRGRGGRGGYPQQQYRQAENPQVASGRGGGSGGYQQQHRQAENPRPEQVASGRGGGSGGRGWSNPPSRGGGGRGANVWEARARGAFNAPTNPWVPQPQPQDLVFMIYVLIYILGCLVDSGEISGNFGIVVDKNMTRVTGRVIRAPNLKLSCQASLRG